MTIRPNRRYRGSLLALICLSCLVGSGCSSGNAPLAPRPGNSSSPTSLPSSPPSPSASPSASPIATASPTPAPLPTPTPAGFTITGAAGPARYAGFDSQIETFMQQNGIRAGQLAVGKAGTVAYSHAYTNSTDPTYMITQPTSIMRVSSNSKALVTAAMTQLFALGTVTPSTPLWSYLGITAPLLATQTPDARASQITLQELIDHTAGFHDSGSSAPEFNMYAIEQAASDNGPLTTSQFTAYLYGEPLGTTPGTTEVYSNEDYYLLARVIEKATGQPYLTWVNANVLAPIGISDDVVTATAQSGRRPNETTCDDPETGPSVLMPQAATVVPDCYGGISVYEILDGPTSISISAQSLAIFSGHYNVYGLGAREAGYAREGSFVGSISWMESLSDGYDFAFTFNTRLNAGGGLLDISPLTHYFESNVN